MKKCFKCGTSKPRSDFYRHPLTRDGLVGKCRICCKKDVTENRNKNLDKIRKYDRKRSKLEHRKLLNRKTVTNWRQQNPKKYKAQTMVGNALRNGKLFKETCAVCGIKKVHAHHFDYDKPLDVVWLCAEHHALAHI